MFRILFFDKVQVILFTLTVGFLALAAMSGCYVDVDPGPRVPATQIYDCHTYEYCDGYEFYDEFSICTNLGGAIEVEDDFLYSCANYGYYNCYYYECDAFCDSSGLICR